MPDDPIHHDDEYVVNPETHHETSDINVRGVMWFVVIFVAFAAVSHVALWLLFKFFVQLERRNAPPPLTAVQTSPQTNVPALPRLQPFPTKGPAGVMPPYTNTPVTDMQDMRNHEDEVLNNYGWTDRTNGIAHIPIEEAKRIALRSGVYRVNNGQAAPAPAGAAAPGAQVAAPPAPGTTASPDANPPSGAASTTGTVQ